MSIQNPLSATDFQLAILQAQINTGITQLSAGGKARGFGDAIADQLSQKETRQFSNLAATLFPYATGQNLDFLAEQVGLYRLSAQSGQAQVADQNFEFYVASGTFGDINSGQDINIPAGVQITSPASGGPVYLTDPVTLPASASQAFVSATCSTPGSVGNVGNSVLTSHNFVGYAQAAFGSLLVTNNYGVIGGQDEESDENLRSRINMKMLSPSGVNQSAIQEKIDEIPGIQNVVFSSQAGNFTCYVYSIVPQPAASLLQNVQTVINQMIAYPLTGTAVAPDLVGISLSTTLTLAGSVTSTDQANIVSAAVSAVQTYINNLPINSPLILNQISPQIFSADSRILGVGKPNQPLLSILIWRSRVDGTRYSRYLTNDFQPALGERIIVETNPQVPTPISFTVTA